MEGQNNGYVMICPKCGLRILEDVNYCPRCGVDLKGYAAQPYSRAPEYRTYESQYNRLAALLLCIFVGVLGVHRFYVGKIGTGLLWLFTGGCFGIGSLVDLIMICMGSFTDQYGMPVTNWNGTR